jgi:hypothetical protein
MLNLREAMKTPKTLLPLALTGHSKHGSKHGLSHTEGQKLDITENAGHENNTSPKRGTPRMFHNGFAHVSPAGFQDNVSGT